MKLDLAISPCPNDTFIFHHLIQNGIAGHPVGTTFADVEELNRRALEKQRHQITKLSFFAMSKLQQKYELLNCGAALGHSCGPLLISYNKTTPASLASSLSRLLIPGRWTTANLLLQLFLGEMGIDTQKVAPIYRRYDQIIPSLLQGDADFGLIIHEERFTYQEQGLYLVQDLGEWWEKSSGLPIPLGCVAVRRDLPEQLRRSVESSIRTSLKNARSNPAATLTFIKQHAQSLQNEVIEQHIKLYVNQFSEDLGAEGHKAVEELYRRAATVFVS